MQNEISAPPYSGLCANGCGTAAGGTACGCAGRRYARKDAQGRAQTICLAPSRSPRVARGSRHGYPHAQLQPPKRAIRGVRRLGDNRQPRRRGHEHDIRPPGPHERLHLRRRPRPLAPDARQDALLQHPYTHDPAVVQHRRRPRDRPGASARHIFGQHQCQGAGGRHARLSLLQGLLRQSGHQGPLVGLLGLIHRRPLRDAGILQPLQPPQQGKRRHHRHALHHRPRRVAGRRHHHRPQIDTHAPVGGTHPPVGRRVLHEPPLQGGLLAQRMDRRHHRGAHLHTDDILHLHYALQRRQAHLHQRKYEPGTPVVGAHLSRSFGYARQNHVVAPEQHRGRVDDRGLPQVGQVRPCRLHNA